MDNVMQDMYFSNDTQNVGLYPSLMNQFTGNLDYRRELEAMEKANTFTAQQEELNRQFNAEEAQKNRDFQERMSNTAYERAVADMQRAGLNPYLFYSSGGSGATTPSGSTASSSTSGSRSSVPHSSGKGFQTLASMVSNVVSSAFQLGGSYVKAKRPITNNNFFLKR